MTKDVQFFYAIKLFLKISIKYFKLFIVFNLNHTWKKIISFHKSKKNNKSIYHLSSLVRSEQSKNYFYLFHFGYSYDLKSFLEKPRVITIVKKYKSKKNNFNQYIEKKTNTSKTTQ